MKSFFTLIVALAIILSGATTLAAQQLIEASGEYVLDPRLDETAASATARAREEAKRAAVDKAGVYLQSYSKMINLELVEDEVQTVASRLLKIQEELPPKMEPVNNGTLIKFTVTIKALVDDLDENTLKAMMQDKQSLEEAKRKYEELKEKYDALNNQMETFKRKYDKANDTQRIEIKRAVARNTESFSAVASMARANDFYFAKNYSQALAAYDEAIRLNPQLAEAYNNRGIVKYETGQYASAVEDYTAAIRLKSNFVDALNNRGNAYMALNHLNDAAQDLQAALKLNPNSAAGHNNLGSVYYSMKNYDAAIGEYTRAIQLNPNFPEAYYNRAVAHYVQGNLIQSLRDMKEARTLNPTDAETQAFYEKIAGKIA